jgi:hypothetical protein
LRRPKRRAAASRPLRPSSRLGRSGHLPAGLPCVDPSPRAHYTLKAPCPPPFRYSGETPLQGQAAF